MNTPHDAPRLHPAPDTETIAKIFVKKLHLANRPQHTFQFAQAWLERREPAFQPATAILCPGLDALDCVVAMSDTSIASRANGFNQNTWSLGDVVELFIAPAGSETYWELHLTPNNHRLQLQWTKQTLDGFRAGQTDISRHLIHDPDFFAAQAFANHAENYWVGHFSLPWRSIGMPTPSGSYAVEIALCRGDSPAGSTHATLSATAAFARPNFHAREHWQHLNLRP